MSGKRTQNATRSSGNRPSNDAPLPTTRSRVGNGNALFPDVDGRSAEMRRYKDIFRQLVSDMGGDPSEAQTIIARRAATLAVWCESAEATMARGEAFDVGEFTTATNALRRLLLDLGLKRTAKDIGPTIAGFLTRPKAAA